MQFEEVLLSEHSRAATNAIIKAIQKQPERINELMNCFFSDEYRICQRASWPLGDIGEKFPDLIIPFLPKLIANLKNPKHDAVIRNTVRTWQHMTIPEAFQGEVYEICFNYILDPKVAIAIRAFSMTVCANIGKDNPELKEELILAIEDQLEHGSSGLRSRGNNIIKMLKKIE